MMCASLALTSSEHSSRFYRGLEEVVRFVHCGYLEQAPEN